jgi:HEAT repeat protein
VNPDDDVVRSNLARFEANPTYYAPNIITPGLSEDAIPALVEAFRTTKNPQMVEFLKDYLGFQYARLERNGDIREWATFHLSRQETYDKLKKLMEEGALYRCHLDSTCYLGKR